MGITLAARKVLIVAIGLSTIALLSSCFLFESHSVAYTVNLSYSEGSKASTASRTNEQQPTSTRRQLCTCSLLQRCAR